MLKICMAFCSFSNSVWSTYAHGLPVFLEKSISLYSPFRNMYPFNKTYGVVHYFHCDVRACGWYAKSLFRLWCTNMRVICNCCALIKHFFFLLPSFASDIRHAHVCTVSGRHNKISAVCKPCNVCSSVNLQVFALTSLPIHTHGDWCKNVLGQQRY